MLSRFLILFVTALCCQMSFAQDDFSEDDTYDPFADYSEFDASEDEEADIHFFKNGRFFNVGLLLGARAFTGNLSEVSDPNVSFGLYIAYFFDIRSALQVSYLQSEHNMNFAQNTDTQFDGLSGNVSLSTISIDYKYYFNTENITRGFADLNPYLIGGVNINYRTITTQGEDIVVKSSPIGFEAGAGIEIPMSRNKMYLGLQVLYHYVSFPDENDYVQDNTGDDLSDIKPSGDYMTAYLIFGFNF